MILRHCSVLTLLLSGALAVPWSAPDALASLASASSAPSDPYTNIADLRRRHEKIRRFEEEKLVVGSEGADDVDADAGRNDASPDAARKRLGAVLEKIRGIFNRNAREDEGGNEIDDDEQGEVNGEEEVVATEVTSGRFGQIGVFFVELLGSLVGLAYGAVAHFNNITAPPQDV